MWLHVPIEFLSPPTGCPSALESAGSTSDSSSLSPDTELYATSSGTPSPRPYSWPGWRSRPWTRLLSGTTSPPSSLVRGVESWISSLRATLASHSPMLAQGGGSLTPVTFGRTSLGSFATYDPTMCSWRTSQGTFPWASSEFSGTWPNSGSMRNGTCFPAPRWELPTSVNDSSAWPTPAARDEVAVRWATPKASLDKCGRPREKEFGDLKAQVFLWQTPRAVAKTGGDRQRNGTMIPTLAVQAMEWPTPSAESYGSNQGGAAGRVGRVRPSLQTLASRIGLPDRTETGASSPKNSGPHLNPRFVEWLMGLPVNWTHPFEPTAFGQWETRLARLLPRWLGGS